MELRRKVLQLLTSLRPLILCRTPPNQELREKVKMLCASMDAYAGDASEALSMYSINGGQMTLIRYPNLLRRLNLFIELLMDHTDHRRIEVCQDLASLALKYSSESDQFGKVMFQFLLGDSFDSLHLGGSVPIMTGPVQESSKSIKEQAPLQSVYVFEDRFKTQHIVDSSITDFDFFPEQNAVISARSSVVFYTCRVLEFTDREVLVKWETDGSKVWLPRSSRYLQSLDRGRQRHRRNWPPLSPAPMISAHESNSDHLVEPDVKLTNISVDLAMQTIREGINAKETSSSSSSSHKYKPFFAKTITFADAREEPWKPPRLFVDLARRNGTVSELEESLRQLNKQIDRVKKLRSYVISRDELPDCSGSSKLFIPNSVIFNDRFLSEDDEKALKCVTSGHSMIRQEAHIDRKMCSHVVSRTTAWRSSPCFECFRQSPNSYPMIVCDRCEMPFHQKCESSDDYSFPPILFGDLSYNFICRRCVLSRDSFCTHNVTTTFVEEEPNEVNLKATPSLVGDLVYDDSLLPIIEGSWAMMDEHHSNPEKTGEFRITRISDVESECSLNGSYEGTFTLKAADGKLIKVHDCMELKFVFSSLDEAIVTGKGKNKFGSFTVIGNLSCKTKLHLYKVFTPASADKKRRRDFESVSDYPIDTSRFLDVSSYSVMDDGSYIRRLDKDWIDILNIVLVHLTVIASSGGFEKFQWFSFDEIVGCIYYNWSSLLGTQPFLKDKELAWKSNLKLLLKSEDFETRENENGEVLFRLSRGCRLYFAHCLDHNACTALLGAVE